MRKRGRVREGGTEGKTQGGRERRGKSMCSDESKLRSNF